MIKKCTLSSVKRQLQSNLAVGYINNKKKRAYTKKEIQFQVVYL